MFWGATRCVDSVFTGPLELLSLPCLPYRRAHRLLLPGFHRAARLQRRPPRPPARRLAALLALERVGAYCTRRGAVRDWAGRHIHQAGWRAEYAGTCAALLSHLESPGICVEVASHHTRGHTAFLAVVGAGVRGERRVLDTAVHLRTTSALTIIPLNCLPGFFFSSGWPALLGLFALFVSAAAPASSS